MNWYTAKTILIVCFLMTNVFLLVNILTAAGKAAAIPEEIIDSTVQILAGKQITIDKTRIPRKNVSMPSPEVQNIITDYEAFAAKLLGDGLAEETPGVFSNEAGRVQFEGDRFLFAPSSPSYLDTSIKPDARALLEQLGIDVSDASMHLSDDGKTAVFSQEIAGYPLFGCSITVLFNDHGLETIEGCWFVETDKPLFRQKNTVKNAPSALIDFSSAASRPQHALTVSALTLGYAVDGDGYHATAALSPIWCIETEADGPFYIQAAENQ